MADINNLYNLTIPNYQKPEDLDFPVSKIRLFLDILWQAVTGKTLTEDQKTTLKQLIDLLNLLDEHKHESEKELISAMLPSISPLLQKMPTLGVTGTHVFAHLVPMYQLYLPSIEKMVKDAHPFTEEETLLYYQTTIFDHLFLMHIFETEANVNLIEMLLVIKALILTNALVYDYHQHVSGRSISFFTFLVRGGVTSEQLLPFLESAVNRVKEEAKQTVSNTSALEALEFLSTKLLETTKTTSAESKAVEDKEKQALDEVLSPNTPPQQVKDVFNQVTETPVEEEVPSIPPTSPTVSEPEIAPPTPAAPSTPTPPVSSPLPPLSPSETPVSPALAAVPPEETPMSGPAVTSTPPQSPPPAPAPTPMPTSTPEPAPTPVVEPLVKTPNPMLEQTAPSPASEPASPGPTIATMTQPIPETPSLPATPVAPVTPASPLSESPILTSPPASTQTQA